MTIIKYKIFAKIDVEILKARRINIALPKYDYESLGDVLFYIDIL